jgi:excisionase family DNA binding protein
MENKTLIHNVEPNQLIDLFDGATRKLFEKFKKELLDEKAKDELLTRKQACELLQIEQTTLYHWTNAGKIICYGIGNRRYYKRSEIILSLKQLKK